jgi:hypothetical protein
MFTLLPSMTPPGPSTGLSLDRGPLGNAHTLDWLCLALVILFTWLMARVANPAPRDHPKDPPP